MVIGRDVVAGRLSDFQNTDLDARPERGTPGYRAAVPGDDFPASYHAKGSFGGLCAGIHPVPVPALTRFRYQVSADQNSNDLRNPRLADGGRSRPGYSSACCAE